MGRIMEHCDEGSMLAVILPWPVWLVVKSVPWTGVAMASRTSSKGPSPVILTRNSSVGRHYDDTATPTRLPGWYQLAAEQVP